MALAAALSPSNYARVLGFATGAATSGLLLLETEALIWERAKQACEAWGYQHPEQQLQQAPSAPAQWGARTRALLVLQWNATVDAWGKGACRTLAEWGL